MPETFPNKPFRIRAEMKQTDLQGNRLRGLAAVMGNLDYGQDVIFPGAFKSCLPDFIKNGFVAQGHEWDDLPIAWPVSAEEQGNALVTEAEFHSTIDAQAARTVCKERLDNGKTVGLSVGFQSDPNGCHYFENGKNLLTFAGDNGYDLKMFDTKGITAWDSWCRGITKIAELFEYSVVTVPMNPMAVATDAKEYDLSIIQDERTLESFLRDVGLSKNGAKKFISVSKGIFLRRDAASDEPSTETKSEEADGETLKADEEKAEETDTGKAEEDGTETPSEPIIQTASRRMIFTSTGRLYQCLP